MSAQQHSLWPMPPAIDLRPRPHPRCPQPRPAPAGALPRDAVPDLLTGTARRHGGSPTTTSATSTLGLAVQRVLDEDCARQLRRGRRLAGGDERAAVTGLAPDRDLHLFDHLRGRSRYLGPAARRRGLRASATRLQQAVRARVGYAPNVHLHPGYVPETLAAVDAERFAVVVLDLVPLRADTGVAGVLLRASRRPAATSSCTTTTTRSPTGRASGRSTRFSTASRSASSIVPGDMWGSAMIRRS